MKKSLYIKFNEELDYYELWITGYNPDDLLYPTIYSSLIHHSQIRDKLKLYAKENYPDLYNNFLS